MAGFLLVGEVADYSPHLTGANRRMLGILDIAEA
jgi:hypothetical protein